MSHRRRTSPGNWIFATPPIVMRAMTAQPLEFRNDGLGWTLQDVWFAIPSCGTNRSRLDCGRLTAVCGHGV
jgi:hypothetical protein